MRTEWKVMISRDECVRRVRAANQTHFDFMGIKAVRATFEGGVVRLRGRHGDRSLSRGFLTRVDAVFDQLPGGQTRISCQGDLILGLVVLFNLWFAALALAGGLLVKALLFGPAAPPFWPAAAMAGALCALALAGAGLRYLLEAVAGAGEQAYLTDALARAVTGASQVQPWDRAISAVGSAPRDDAAPARGRVIIAAPLS